MNIEKINELFKCKFCNEIYKEPIILSCGHKICKKDLSEILVENKVELKFQQMCRCHVCLDTMIVPENGFPVDKDFNIFSNMADFKGIDFGEKYKRFREAIDSFETNLEQLKYLSLNPDFFITEYFQKIRYQIESERLELVDEINNHYSECLMKVNLIENECKTAVKNPSISGTALLPTIDREIEIFEKNLVKLSSEIDIMRVNEENWEKITFESNYQKLKLNRIFKYHQDILLQNRNYSFVSKKLAIENILSNPIIKYEEIQASKNSDRGYVQFCLTDFRNFTKKKASLFRSEQCELGGYKWNLKFRNLDDQNLCWTLHCDMNDINKVLNCTIRFEIMNLSDPEKSESRRLKLAFNSSRTGHGIEKFISFQDLFKNGFYDESNDSIHINYYVSINEVLKLNY